MTDQNEEVARLEELNRQLSESLSRCRRILRDCRESLAANSNNIPPPEEDEETRLA